MVLRLGDLVVCSARSFREQARLGLDVGLYLSDRKRDGLVYFARPDRSEWIPKKYLKAADGDDPRLVAAPQWVTTLHQVVRLLLASDLALERSEDGGFEVRVGTLWLDRARIDRLEAILGEDALSLSIRPGSMSRLLVVYSVK